MFINDKTAQNTKKLMRKISSDAEEEKRIRHEDARLCREIEQMNRQSKSVQRTGDQKKIQRFNELFFKKTQRLTILRGKQGSVDSKEINKLVNQNKWKVTN